MSREIHHPNCIYHFCLFLCYRHLFHCKFHSLDAKEALSRFQAGQLKESYQEWHLLVTSEACDALGKVEVQRQSVIFEIIKSERDYVSDLEAVEQVGVAHPSCPIPSQLNNNFKVFIDQLQSATPPIMSVLNLNNFIHKVFGNLHEILVYHRQILAALYDRQREQHPLILTIADIFLDGKPLLSNLSSHYSSFLATLKGGFRNAYEIYIKNYPLAESHHRKMLKQSRAYENFMQSITRDPRIRKRDLITFLSRPVTRLPRLNLLLEQTLKLTSGEADHSDLETLPLISSILKDCIKSTQPGIEAAESKVKFWGLCESLVFQKGEIIVSRIQHSLFYKCHEGGFYRIWIYLAKPVRWCISVLFCGEAGVTGALRQHG